MIAIFIHFLQKHTTMGHYKYLLVLCILYFACNYGAEGSQIWGKLCKKDCWTDCHEIAPDHCIESPGELNNTKFKALKLVHGKHSLFHWALTAFNNTDICDQTTLVAAYPLELASQCLNITLQLRGMNYSFLYVDGPAPPFDSTFDDELALDATPPTPYILISIPLVLMVVAIVVAVVAIVRAIRRQKQRSEERGFDVLELYDDDNDANTQVIHTEDEEEEDGGNALERT
jgi:hypothetical protein